MKNAPMKLFFANVDKYRFTTEYYLCPIGTLPKLKSLKYNNATSFVRIFFFVLTEIPSNQIFELKMDYNRSQFF